MRRAVVVLALFTAVVSVVPADTTTAATGAAGTTPAASATGAASTSAAASADPTKPDLSVPKDDGTKWVVGFTVLASDGLSMESRYLAYSLPLLLRDEVSGLTSHLYSDKEIDALRRLIVARQIATGEQTVTNVRKDRDALLFGDSPQTSDALKTMDLRLKAAVARGDFLRALDASLISVLKEKPVTMKSADESGKLLDAPKIPARQYCEAQSLDLLIGGSLQEVQGYLLLDLWAYSAARQEIVFSARDAARRDDLYAGAPEMGKGIAETILGRPWAMVRFAPNPPNSSLLVDGALVATGASPALYLVPGPHLIRIQAPGHAPVERSVVLESGAVAPVEDTLEKTVTGSISVGSVPEGADLYLDSIWIGKTPLVMGRPTGRSRGLLSLPGFYDLPFAVLPDSPPAVSFVLQQDLGTRDALQKKAREDFYTSFGWFAISLALPVFSYALAIDFASQRVAFLDNGDAVHAASAESARSVFGDLYYGGIAVSASLFVWMVFRIINYVTVSNGIAG